MASRVGVVKPEWSGSEGRGVAQYPHSVNCD